MSNMTVKKPRALRIDPALDMALVALAKTQERTVSWVIERAVREYVADHADRPAGFGAHFPGEGTGPLTSQVSRLLQAKHSGQ